ncbi:MAG: hypothetical protein DHS20C08_11110 [Rhodomicrobium sp.]|nr:MAG: hypothetical protein DHS20C08_11110 [Rhodomicrobium sp.]
MIRTVALVSLLLLAFCGKVFAEEPQSKIKFPENYKTDFVNYLSLDRTQNDDQIIRLFASEEVLKAVKATGEFPDGAVIVGEIYKAKKDEDGEVIESDLSRRIRDKFALVAVMEKRKGWGEQFSEEFRNGDWDFAAFKPDGSVAKKNLNDCRKCHAPLTDTKHVFSYEHMK